MEIKISKTLLVIIIVVTVIFAFFAFSINNIVCQKVDDTTRNGLSKVIQQQGDAIKQIIPKILQAQKELVELRGSLGETNDRLADVSKKVEALEAKQQDPRK
jgi:peptidoglycan hydrolase CwlO-like protein